MIGQRRDIPRTIVLIGLMGAGKTSIGRRLAERLRLPFTDADAEIEKAAGCSIADFFERYGEEEFRIGERRVIKRLLEGPVQVLSTGGGAFMHPETRAEIRAHAISIWLRADLDTLAARIGRRDDRPLLKQGEPRAVLERLMAERYPVYAEADIIVDSADAPQRVTVDRVLEALDRYLSEAGEAADQSGARA
jgi:shikimate kinase